MLLVVLLLLQLLLPPDHFCWVEMDQFLFFFCWTANILLAKKKEKERRNRNSIVNVTVFDFELEICSAKTRLYFSSFLNTWPQFGCHVTLQTSLPSLRDALHANRKILCSRAWPSSSLNLPPLSFHRPSVRHSVCKASSQTANSTAPQNTRISWRLFHKNVTPVGTPPKKAHHTTTTNCEGRRKKKKRKE